MSAEELDDGLDVTDRVVPYQPIDLETLFPARDKTQGEVKKTLADGAFPFKVTTSGDGDHTGDFSEK